MGAGRRMVPTFRAAAGLLTLVTILAAALVLIRSADAAVDIARPPALLAKTTPSAAELTNSSAGRQSTTGSSVNSSAEGSSPAGALSASNPAGSASTALTTDGTSASSESTNSTSTNPSSTEPSSIESNTSSSSPNPAPTSVGATVAPATPPAAAQSEIGRGTLLIAIGVLVIATAMMILALVLTLNRRRPRTATAAAREATTGRGPPIPIVPVSAEHQDGWSSPVDGSSLTDVMAMLVELGDTMIDSGDPVTHVRDTLQRLAEINGIAAPEIIVLPTALIITLPGMEETRTEVASTGESTLRLDQVEAIFTVADAAERGEIGPRVALVELRSARNLPPSFGPAVIMGGHAVIAMGLALILSGGWTEVGVAAVLGAGVGVIKQWAARRPIGGSGVPALLLRIPGRGRGFPAGADRTRSRRASADPRRPGDLHPRGTVDDGRHRTRDRADDLRRQPVRLRQPATGPAVVLASSAACNWSVSRPSRLPNPIRR